MPSRSRFQNLFFYYRGPTSRDPGREEAERAFDIQLEDNTTKALINVLESSAPAVTASFLTELLGEQVEADARRPFVYSLQGADPAARDADRRYLVGISMLGETGVVNEGAAEQQQSLGRVDAAIHRRNDLLIVFEAKVGSSDLQRQQLDQHAGRWKIAQPERKIVRWPELYSWAERELATNRHDEVTAFLLGQLIEFLELTELAPFRGFRDDDFEFFKTLALEQRPVVKNRLAGLGQEVVSLLTEAERDAIGELHVGQLGEGADQLGSIRTRDKTS
jgi:hypothetical protein